MRPEVDEFFDRVLVMAQQEEIRQNRLTLPATERWAPEESRKQIPGRPA